MAEEEKSESTGGSLKNILLGLVSTITLGVGGWFTTKLTGGEEDKAPVQQAAPVINIQNTQNQSQSAGGKTVIIKEKAVGGGNAQPAAQPKPKKKEGDEFKEEAPKW
jgi:hypothetical protein